MIAEEIQHHQWIILCAFQRGFTFVDVFLTDKALEVLEPAYAQAQSLQSDYWMHIIASVLSEAYLQKQEFAKAAKMLETVIKPQASAETTSERIAWLVKTQLLLAQGDCEGAMSCLDQLVASSQDLSDEGEFDIPGVSLLRGIVITELIRTGQAQSQAERAETALLSVKTHAERWPKYSLLWRAHGALGRFYSVVGKRSDAEQHFTEAQGILDKLAGELSPELRPGFLKGANNYLNTPNIQGENRG
jgi:tetratricopeptide (TPR) repeat protein